MERCGTGTNALVFPTSVGSEGVTRVSLTAHPLNGAASCLSSLALGGVVVGDALVLLWGIRGMIRQDGIDQAERFVTDR